MDSNLNPAAHEIAIISANCRFPGSNSPDEFWGLLGHSETEIVLQENRREYFEELKNEVNFLKCPVDEFDADFFKMSSSKAVLLDPQQRLLMELTWEALEEAFINPYSLRGSATGVFVGAWAVDYEKVIAQSSLAGNREFHQGYISTSYGALSSHISYFLGLCGKHLTIEKGPASSLFSIAQACKSLERGECNLAIAAGINLVLFPKLGKTRNFAHEKTAEGCGIVILKRLTDAVADGDEILGIIRSVGICMDATGGKFGDISGVSLEKAMRKALLIAKDSRDIISYVELLNGEEFERKAIESVYKSSTNSEIVIDSVSKIIGNAEAASGFASLIKILMCFKHEKIPISSIITPKLWEKSKTRKRYAAINSYGFTGECAHLILEEPPDFAREGVKQNHDGFENILTLSANSSLDLDKLLEKYKMFISSTEESISDICFTSSTCRAHLSHRISMHAKNKEDFLALIENKKFHIGKSGINSSQKPKVAFLYNSHNSFCFNWLSQEFYANNVSFKEALDKCSEIFQDNVSIKMSLKDLLWNECILDEDKQKYLLPINFCAQYCLTELLKSFGISPDVTLGHSTGEFSAACAAGVLSLRDTLKYLIQISKEINSLHKITLTNIKTSKSITEKLLSFYFDENPEMDPSELKIFAINSPEQVIVSGNSRTVTEKFATLCLEENIEAKIMSNFQNMINFRHASSKPFANNVEIRDTSNCMYVSGCTGKILANSHTLCESNYWDDFYKNPVNFSEGFKTLWLEGCRIFIDIGTSAELLRLAKLNISQTQSASCVWSSCLNSQDDNLSSLATLLSKLFVSGVDINWKIWNGNVCRKKVHLPKYPFQRKRFWPK